MPGCNAGTVRRMARKQGEKTANEGVLKLGPGLYLVRATATDPRTGKRRQKEQEVSGSERDAVLERSALIQRLLQDPGVVVPGGLPARPRVSDFATFWLDTKLSGSMTAGTGERYGMALQHFVDACGQLYMTDLRQTDVQAWVNLSLKGAAPQTVHGWFRVVRTMVRDALAPLGMPYDPTMRVSFPDLDAKHAGPNSLTPEQLGAFLDAVRMTGPQHYAVITFMAYTGMRFCHVSPLRWEDIDEREGVIHVTKSQVHGVLGKMKRKKKAPPKYPLDPGLLKVLEWHRGRLLRHHRKNWPGFESGLVFPSRVGKLRTGPSNMRKVWRAAQEAAGLAGMRLTPHGLRRTFEDLRRRAKIDAIIGRSLTGHVTETMQERYSSVGIDEQRAAVKTIMQLVPRG